MIRISKDPITFESCFEHNPVLIIIIIVNFFFMSDPDPELDDLLEGMVDLIIMRFCVDSAADPCRLHPSLFCD